MKGYLAELLGQVTMASKAFIIDLDDTLVYCGKYYDQCKGEFADYMAKFGMPRDECLKRFAKLDLERARDTRVDFESRFPGSMTQLFKTWCIERRITITPEQELEVAKIGFSVYESAFEPMPDAHNMLYELSHEYTLYLYTKGNEKIQIKKILKADLDPYFKGVWITDAKTLKMLTMFMLKHELSTRSTWVLGNSTNSDILPSVELGIPVHQSIYIESYEWEEDHGILPVGVHRIKTLGEVVPITNKLIVEGALKL